MTDMNEQPLELSQLIDPVRKRLISHYGEEKAKSWLKSENGGLGGKVPGIMFRDEERQHDFLDATSEWPLEDTGRMPRIVTG